MKRPLQHRRRTFGVGAILIGVVVAFSSLAIVRAERVGYDAKVFTCAKKTACVAGEQSGSGPGVAGSSVSGYGVSGTSTGKAGVFGKASDSAPGVYGVGQDGYGVQGSSSSVAAVFGESTSTGSGAPALYGYSKGPSDAIAGINVSKGGGVGVLASTLKGDAVYATAYEGIAVYASTTTSGTNTTQTAAVWGNGSPGGIGVYGTGYSGLSGYGTTCASCYYPGVAVAASVDDTQTDLFDAANYYNRADCLIDADANLSCTGKITGGALREKHHASTGRHVLAYASESTSATMEDFGHARLFNGVKNVMIPRDFASVVDASDYYVFLTPLGDASLYVSIKTSTGFQVRETNRGRSNVAFDYRIVARPIDASADRLPPAPSYRKPHIGTNPSVPFQHAPLPPPRPAP
jgi:hypothetical protein